MNRENLVILKGKSTVVIQANGTRIEPNKHYRCVEVTRTKERQFLVYGVHFDEASFNQLFEFFYDKVLREFKTLGLIGENNKPLTKKAFKECASVHQYGRGKGMLNVLYFYIQPKECIYAFHPQFQGDSKAKCIDNAYKMYLDLLNGEMDEVDNREIQRGNCGIPICYGDLNIRPEWNPSDEKLEIYY